MKKIYILFSLLSLVFFESFNFANAQGNLFWCVPRPGVSDAQLQANLDYVCGQPDIDCSPIQPGGPCYVPNTVASHAAFAMNLFFQTRGIKQECNFSDTAILTNINPSFGNCEYLVK
ncbi:Glucan endo-1,3-beta-D-glucosidase [Linum grandiflorum]